ncbi:hypothetical protein MS3_00007014 [Schistosoma haematobium]|uniref:Junction plakoglobin n=1 Tax=Schistosoma haematobium TaxID=6185 RepID=A0A922LIM5_SCHHA|nr:hypothetical protein MS3_00007014 [Schistosoma haematobium]KAH9585919.1 hypothetical protein MS3_00007014 [Schistosoma haematobium]CAH8533018.1 unnamed protein product [Schistosoma haematobium]
MTILSEGKVTMDFEVGFDSSGSDSSSLYNSDSGVSVETPASCNTSAAFNFERPDDAEYLYCDLLSFYETHSVTVIQAVQCLSNVDIDISLNACTYLFNLCRCGYASFIARICPDVFYNVKIPVFCPSSSKYVDVVHCMSGIINYFSQCPDGLVMIVHNGGLDVINGLLLFPFESVLYFCVTALHNILLSHKTAKGLINRTCISNRLINLLNYSVEHVKSDTPYSLTPSNFQKSINPKFLAVLCDCLYILAYRSESTKKTFKEQGGLSSLLKVIMISTYEKVLWTATRLLRVLSAWIPVKYEIIAQDPHLDFFTHCLECHSSRVITNALWTMRNLSDIAVNNITSDVSVNVVRQLLHQLRLNICSDSYGAYYSTNTGGDTPMSRCVLGALANLTCRNNAAKSYVVRHNGIDLIMQILYSEISGQKNYYHTFCDNLSQSMLNMSIQCKNDNDHSNIVKKCLNKLHNNDDNNNNHYHVTKSPIIATTTTTVSSSSSIINNQSIKQKNELHLLNHFSSYNNNKLNNLLNISIFNSTLDLIEAGLRCLSHLTIGHMELINVYHYFIHQRIASKLIISMGNIYLPLLLSFPFDQYINLYKDTTINTTTNNNNDNWEFDCLTQILQLTKTWTILVRNLCINYYNNDEFTSITKANSYDTLLNNNSSNNTNTNLWPKHLRSQFRHGIHKLVQNLRHLINTIPRDLQPKELKPTMEFVHNVSMTLFSLNSNNNNNNGHINNSTTTNYDSQ